MTQTKPWKKLLRVLLLLLAAGWMATIFLLSAQDGGRSAGLSARVIRKAVSLLDPSFGGMGEAGRAAVVECLQLLVRKAAHFSAYGLLGALTMAFAQTFALRQRAYFALSLGVCLAYAAADELHQAFVPGRGPSVVDVCIDFSGAVLGALFVAGVCAIVRCHFLRAPARAARP